MLNPRDPPSSLWYTPAQFCELSYDDQTIQAIQPAVKNDQSR